MSDLLASSNTSGRDERFVTAPWRDQVVMFFDGDCGLCNRSVRFVLDHESDASILFCTLQSATGQVVLASLGKEANDFDSVIVWSGGKLHDRSSAVIQIISKLKWPFRFLGVLSMFPKFVRDYCYLLVAKNRHSFFKASKDCLLMTEQLRARFLDE